MSAPVHFRTGWIGVDCAPSKTCPWKHALARIERDTRHRVYLRSAPALYPWYSHQRFGVFGAIVGELNKQPQSWLPIDYWTWPCDHRLWCRFLPSTCFAQWCDFDRYWIVQDESIFQKRRKHVRQQSVESISREVTLLCGIRGWMRGRDYSPRIMS